MESLQNVLPFPEQCLVCPREFHSHLSWHQQPENKQEKTSLRTTSRNHEGAVLQVSLVGKLVQTTTASHGFPRSHIAMFGCVKNELGGVNL